LQGNEFANGKAALFIIGAGLDDFDAALFGVFSDLVGLIVGRILLVLSRHAHILRRPKIGNLATPVKLSLRSIFNSVGCLRGWRRVSS